jgi:hypothetical protein
MTLEALSNLAKIGKIKAEPMNRAEIDRMLVMARKRLADSSYPQVSQEGRFTSVYNAIHGAALAALRWHGYRSENRYIVFQSLGQTLAWPASQWRVLDAAHQKRNLAEYEGFLEIEESAIAELRLLAEKLFADVDRLIGAGKDTNIA